MQRKLGVVVRLSAGKVKKIPVGTINESLAVFILQTYNASGRIIRLQII